MKLTLLGVLLLASAGAGAAELRGRVELFADGQPLRASEASEAVVYFRPKVPAPVAAVAEPVVMTTRRKQFVPRVLAITAGTSVRFPNEDPILHNTFSTSANNAFDAGLYGQGDGITHTFATPGLVKVYCNVHHSMFGFILVLDTPHFTRPDAKGNFELAGLPAGEGELVVYHDRAQPWRQRLDGARGGDVAVRIDLNKRKVPVHMNKFGKPYRGGTSARPY